MRGTTPPPTSLSASIIAGNDDLLTEILVRTPVKSLIRFKCVSNHLYSLISGPHFCLLHTLRNPNRKISGLLLRKTLSIPTTATSTNAADSDSDSNSEFEFVPLNGSSLFRPPPFRSLDFIHGRPSGSGTKIIQSCNGLFLCCSFPNSIGTARSYYVVNPTTKQSMVLDLPRVSASTTIFGVNLAFDPYKSPHYKVVCVRSTPLSIYCYQIEIYSSENRCWRLSGDGIPTRPFDMVFTDGIFCHGSVHWISPTGASLRFDLDLWCLGRLPGITTIDRYDTDCGRRRSFLGESNSHLHLIEVHGTQFRVLEMEGDYSKWYVKYVVDLDGAVGAFPEMVGRCLDPSDGNRYVFSILGVFRNDNEDESMLVLNIPGKVISYNFKDATVKELLDFAPWKIDKKHVLQFGCYDSYQYVESLAPV